MRFLFCLLFAFAGVVCADELNGHCDKHLLVPALHPKPGRKYARDRLVDLIHLKLDVVPDFAKRTITATAEWRFKPIARPLTKLTLDAVGLHIDSIMTVGSKVASFQSTEEELVINFDSPVPAGSAVTVIIAYHVQPEVGLYFRTPEMGYKAGDTQVWSQGEAEEHRYWFPCYDYPNERFTSEVLCHVPEAMEVISNGHIVETTHDANGLKVVHWLQDKPHVNYLVALAAGYFHKIEDSVGKLPLAVFVPPSEKDQATNAFLDTKKIIKFYEKEIGTPFPWDKYHQVYCLDFVAGGMENTSCTFQAADLLYRSETEQIDSLRWLDAHETAHQWFGDLLTSRDWSHVWLNEGFASYYTILYEEEAVGRDAMLHQLRQEADRVFQATDTRPVVWRDYADAADQFDYRVYPKGAWVLHMIRSRLGPDLYRRCIKTYVERFRDSVVRTEDFQKVLEEVTGLSWDQFFDQWLYHGGQPELQAEYSWDAGAKLAKVSIRQTQKVGEQVPLFRLDVPVRFIVDGKPHDTTITVSQAVEDYHFALPKAPELVRFDPDYTVLAKWHFNPPGDMVKKQLKSDHIGRVLAVQALASREDHESIAQLQEVLKGDSFFGVRSEAALALRKIGNPEARGALVQSLNQPDARVRKAVVNALAAFPDAEAQEALWKLAQTEKNPEILAAIIATWGARPGNKAVTAALLAQLASSSYRERLALAALSALRAQNDSSAVPAVLEWLQKGREHSPSRGLGTAMEDLAFLARQGADKSPVRSFLAEHLNDPRIKVRASAAKALGILRDPAAIGLLEPLARVNKPFEDGVASAARKALQTLQASQDPQVVLTNLWQELQELRKEQEKLAKQLQDLKLKADAKPIPLHKE